MEKIKIFIEWTGPYTAKQIKDGVDLGEEYFVKPSDKGLYQIYSSHPLYGDSVLTYIGKTEKAFSKRLNKRSIIEYNKDMNNIQIYLGCLYFDDIYMEINDDTLLKYIEYAETLLINHHAPALNSQNINSFKHWEKDITVVNRGSYRMLEHEVSTIGLYQDENAYKQFNELKEKLTSELKRELIIINDELSYGVYLNKEETLWVGLSYDHWKENTHLVLASEEAFNGIEKHVDDWYYLPLKGKEEVIIKKILEYCK